MRPEYPRVILKSENSGENEASFSARRISRKSICHQAEIGLLKNPSVDENVSRGQMRDQIVAIVDTFC